MENRFSLNFSLISICTFLILRAAFSSPTRDVLSIPDTGVSNSKWFNGAWAGNDVPFAQARMKYEQLDLPALRSMLPQGKFKYRDQLSVFQAGYSAYLCRTKFKMAGAETYVDKAIHAFDDCPSNNSYNFNRLRFLLVAIKGPFNRMGDLGWRLCQRDKSDYDVRFYYNKLLLVGVREADTTRAIQICREMVLLRPKRPSAHTAMGWTYFRCWLSSKKMSDRDKAIASYNKYLELAPANDRFRSRAKELIQMMKSKR